jgi:hypothetical protein
LSGDVSTPVRCVERKCVTRGEGGQGKETRVKFAGSLECRGMLNFLWCGCLPTLREFAFSVPPPSALRRPRLSSDWCTHIAEQRNYIFTRNTYNGSSSETAVSSETVIRRMSSDMFGPLSDKPDGTTTHAQVTNVCFAARERANKNPFLFQEFVAPVPSWPACGRPAQAV